MAALVVDLCEAVAEHLRDRVTNAFSFSFQVVRQNPAFAQLEDTRNTRVFVYPVQANRSIEDRASTGLAYTVMVHLTNWIDGDDSEIDDALLLVEEIEDALFNFAAAGFEMVQFSSEVGGRAPYEVEAVAQQRYFHVPIAVQFFQVV